MLWHLPKTIHCWLQAEFCYFPQPTLKSVSLKQLTLSVTRRESNIFPDDHVQIGEIIFELSHACIGVREITQTYCSVTYIVISGVIQRWSRDAVHVCTKLRKKGCDLLLLLSHKNHHQLYWNHQVTFKWTMEKWD